MVLMTSTIDGSRTTEIKVLFIVNPDIFLLALKYFVEKLLNNMSIRTDVL